jgi:hypothetical protein
VIVLVTVFLIEFGVPMKLVRLIKMCLNEMYSKVSIGKHLSDIIYDSYAINATILIDIYYSVLHVSTIYRPSSGALYYIHRIM